MGAPKGNKNALGNKGGGRSRAVDIEKLWSLWNGDITFDDLHTHYHPDTGTVGDTPFDDLAWRFLNRDEKSVKLVMRALFPRPVIRKVIQYTEKERSLEEIKASLVPQFLK